MTTVADSQSPAVAWKLAPSIADRAPLDRWCAGVGPAVASIRSLSPAQSTVNSLVVITWNTHVGGGDIAGLVNDLRGGRFTDGKPVDHFVLLLQEVYRAGGSVPLNAGALIPRRIHSVPKAGKRVDIVETAGSLGLDLYYVPSMGNGSDSLSQFREDRGNAILSTLPLRDLSAVELPYEGQRRVAAVATVGGTTLSGEQWELRLVNVHLDNRSRASRVFRSLGPGRTRQARALVDILAGDTPVVLGGDLNTWSFGFLEGADEILREHLPLPQRMPMEPTLAVKNGIGPMRLDRLMFSSSETYSIGATRRLDDPRGSDHYPLFGEINFDL